MPEDRKKVAVGLGLAMAATGLVLFLKGRAKAAPPPDGDGDGNGEAAEFIVSELIIEPLEVNVNEQVVITITVTNIGLEAGSYQVIGLAGDSELAKTVSLNPGQAKQVSFTVTPDSPGVYSVAVDGLTGSFDVIEETEPLIPDPIIEGSLTGLALWRRGAWGPTEIQPVISLSAYYDVILIFLHNDTIIDGTKAEFDKRLAYGPFDITVTMNGSPWPVEGTPKMWAPCAPWDKRGKGAWDVFIRFPPVGSYTMVVTLSAQGRLLDTKTVSFTIVQ